MESVAARMVARDWRRLVALSVLWGGSFLFVGVAVREWPPLAIVEARVVLAALALYSALRLSGIALSREARVWRAFFVMGLLNNAIPFSLIVWSQGHIASGLASILNATTPLFTVLVAHGLTADERLTPRKAAGIGLGFAGVVVLMGGAALGRLGVDTAAQAAMLAAAASYAFAGVYGRRFKAMGVAPLATATGMTAASSFLLLPLVLIVDRPWTLPVPSAAAAASLVGLALLSTAAGYILYFRILASAGATNLLLVTFLIPVSAILFGIALLGESLEPRHMLGMVLIGAGLAVIDGRLLSWNSNCRPREGEDPSDAGSARSRGGSLDPRLRGDDSEG